MEWSRFSGTFEFRSEFLTMVMVLVLRSAALVLVLNLVLQNWSCLYH